MSQPAITIAELLAAWREFSKGYYPEHGEQMQMEQALRPLEAFYGSELVADFGPKKLKAVRELTVTGYTAAGQEYLGLSRKTANARIHRIRRVFKWAVSEELAPPSLAHSLAAVDGLRRGRTAAPDYPPIGPVDEATVNRTLPYLSPVIGTMIKLQLFTGMRRGEVLIMRPRDIKRTGEVWEYRPSKHKSEHLGRERVIYLGPKAQEILAPFLKRPLEAFCFSARESRLWWYAKKRMRRKTPVQPSQRNRGRADAVHKPGHSFGAHAYNRAITRACERAGVQHWHPNQLRHTAATIARREFGLEAAQAILGHSRADVTQIYAERNNGLAADVMKQIG